jgi:hypothetical protein
MNCDDIDNWYVRDAGVVAGPFMRSELLERYQKGELDWYHEVSQDRLIWISISTLPPVEGLGFEKRRTRAPRGRPWRLFGVGVAGLAALLGLGFFLNDGGPQDREESRAAEAMLRVLTEEQRIAQETVRAVGANAPPSAYADAIAVYVMQAGRIDVSDCPAEFRVAFRRHLEAWVALRETIKPLPNDAVEGFVVGLLNGYFYGEKDGGLARMTENVQQAAGNVKACFGAVEDIAAKHDVALP